MWQMFAMLASVMAAKMQQQQAEQAAKQQHNEESRMKIARLYDPNVSTTGIENAQFNRQLGASRDASNRQMMGSILPLAMSSLGSIQEQPDSTKSFTGNVSQGLSNQFSQQGNAGMFDEMNQRIGMRPWGN
jgi:hypothetical protein